MRRRFGIILFPAILLVALGSIMARNQALARKIVYQRFESRVEGGAVFVNEFTLARQREEARVAGKRFNSHVIDKADFEIAVESLGFEAAVLLDSRGRLLAIYPSKGALLGTEIASKYRHLSSAVAGTAAVSGVVASAARGIPVVGIAVPYDSAEGRRVFSGAFSVEIGPLGNFMKSLLPYRDSSAYLVDRDGKIAASSSTPQNSIDSLARKDPALGRAFAPDGTIHAGDGIVTRGGAEVAYISRRVGQTGLFVIAAVPTKVLYEPLAQSGWPQWTVFLALVFAVGIGWLLLRRLDQSRKELEVQLTEQARLNKALEDFSGRAAHDMRSPLATIRTAISTIGLAGIDADTRAELLDAIARQSENGIELVDELLELARASGTARRGDVDPAALISELKEQVPELTIEVGELPRTIHVDRVSFLSATVNLARNALKYAASDAAPVLHISALESPQGTIFSFADRGPGVRDPEMIFSPFERRSDLPGTGLGLAIVEAMASAHGGRAWYEDRIGGGADFKILIAPE